MSVGGKKRRAIRNKALDETKAHRQRLLILKLAGKIDFHPDWDYTKMRIRESGISR